MASGKGAGALYPHPLKALLAKGFFLKTSVLPFVPVGLGSLSLL